MSIIMRSDFPGLMVEGLRLLFDESMEEGPTEFEQLYTVDGSDREYEVSLGLVGMGGTVPRKPEANPIRFRGPQQGRPVVYVHQTFALGTMLSLEAKEDDRTNMLSKIIVPELANTMKVTREIDGVALIKNGYTNMGYEPDGVSLFNTAHPLVGGGTSSNRSDVDLSITALGTARAMLRKAVTESGRKMPLIADTLFVPPDGETLAEELMFSTAKPTGGALQGETNVFRRKFNIVVLDYWDDDVGGDAWALRAPVGKRNFRWWNRIMPNSRAWDDPEADVLKFKIRARWSRGFNDWRGWFGSRGA